jgi:hypothetical protein
MIARIVKTVSSRYSEMNSSRYSAVNCTIQYRTFASTQGHVGH